MSFSARLREVLNEKGMTQSKLSEKTGIAKSIISEWLSGKYEPKQDKIYLVADALEVSPSWLFGASDVMEVVKDINVVYDQLEEPRKMKVYSFAEHELEKQNKPKLIRVYGQTAAGEPIEYGDEIIEEKEVLYVPDGADCALHIKGDSMEPEFEDGSVVFYKKQPILENGEIGIFEIDGGVTMKKYKVDYDNQKIHLVSLNKKYDDMIFDEVDIIGKVIK